MQNYRRWPVQIVVLVSVAFVFGMARLPTSSEAEVKELASRFKFETKVLTPAPIPPGLVHDMNPSAHQIRGLVYNLLNHSVAMADLDGDGLSNDLCYNDARAKALMIAPAPGTGDRYPAFVFAFGDKVDLKYSHPIRCGVCDMNEDGLADIYVGFASRAPLLLLRKDTGATGPQPLSSDSFVIRELIPDGMKQLWHSSTATFADMDGDGHFDLLIGNNFKEGTELYHGDSKKPIELPDTWGEAENGGTNRIFLWAGAKGGDSPEVTYREAENGFPGGRMRWTNAVGAADLDRDGLPEVYIANDFGADQLLLNRSTPGKVVLKELFGKQGAGTPASFVMGKDTFHSMAIDFADINRDGMFDMAVSNISNDWVMGESHFLWVSNGDVKSMDRGVAPYENEATKLGTWHSAWAWEIRMDDFDNDGEIELVQGTGLLKAQSGSKLIFQKSWAKFQQFAVLHDSLVKVPAAWPVLDFGDEADGHKRNPFFVRNAEGRFVDVSDVLFPGLTPNTRGIATADVDGDGDLDMAFGNSWEDDLFFTNQAPNPGAFLGLHLLLPLEGGGGAIHDGHAAWREGTPAVGALVDFVHPDGRKMSRQVDGGNGLGGSRSPDLVFGLGKLGADTKIPIRVTWRDRGGALQKSSFELRPGWHTVVLASNQEGAKP